MHVNRKMQPQQRKRTSKDQNQHEEQDPDQQISKDTRQHEKKDQTNIRSAQTQVLPLGRSFTEICFQRDLGFLPHRRVSQGHATQVI